MGRKNMKTLTGDFLAFRLSMSDFNLPMVFGFTLFFET